jgi:TP901 family phage tail tape measure protein
MAAKTLRVNIVGDSKSAEKSLTNLSKTTQTTQTTMGRVGSTLSGVGSAVMGVATKVASFASSGANDFAEWAKQVALVQKTMGGTTEDASRLAYQAKILGVDSQDLALGLRFLGKDMTNGGKGLAKLGISTKDASGHMKTMPEILKEVSAKIQAIPPGAQRTAAILSIFGKRGMALTPILTANASQMADLSKESDQLGYTLDSKATKSVKEHAIEQRRMEAAFKAAKMQLGQALMPVLTDLAKMFAEKIVPLIKQVVDWMKQHQGAVHALVLGIGGLLAALKVLSVGMQVFNVLKTVILGVRAAMMALNLAFLANPITLIIVAIIALVVGFIYLWKNCESFRNFWKGLWRDIVQWAKDAAHWVVTGWDAVIGWFGGLPRWFHDLWFGIWRGITGWFGSAADWVVSKFNALVGWFAALPGRIIDFFANLGGKIVNAIGDIPVIGSIIHLIGGAIPGLAAGGTVTRGGATWVGERGPELLNLPGGSNVVPLSRAGGGGTVVNVTVNVAGNVKAEKDLAVAISGHVRNELRRVGARNGGVVGLA